MQEQLELLQALGLTLPSPAYIFGALLFSFIGIAAWRYGRKRQRPPVRWIGLALMLYPYVVYETWALYLVGCGLCIAAWRQRAAPGAHPDKPQAPSR